MVQTTRPWFVCLWPRPCKNADCWQPACVHAEAGEILTDRGGGISGIEPRGASATAKTRRKRGSLLKADGGRIASLKMLPDKLTATAGTCAPNRIGVADGRTDQHGCAARGGWRWRNA